MLIAHLVPGYLAAAKSQTAWKPGWSRTRRTVLWAAALISTFAPDLDVIYNTLFRGFINHSTLWTHSLFVHLGIAGVWLILLRIGRYPYLRTLVGLVAAGGLSHLVLDVLSHGTPLFYPVSMLFVGMAPTRVVEGGFWAYITDPIFLAEPFLLALAAAHWILKCNWSARVKRLAVGTLVTGFVLFAAIFLSLLPILQSFATVKMAS